jgi:hypothetical protein
LPELARQLSNGLFLDSSAPGPQLPSRLRARGQNEDR